MNSVVAIIVVVHAATSEERAVSVISGTLTTATERGLAASDRRILAGASRAPVSGITYRKEIPSPWPTSRNLRDDYYRCR